jgi:hypothetical protein
VDSRHPEETCADAIPHIRARGGSRRDRDSGDRVHLELDARTHIDLNTSCVVGRGFAGHFNSGDAECCGAGLECSGLSVGGV